MTTSPPRVRRGPEPHENPGEPAESRGGLSARISLGRAMNSESSDYFLLLGITLFMVVFGLVMVLSSSSVESHNDTDNFFSRFWSQGMYTLVGLPLMFIVSRIPLNFWKRSIWFILGAACFVQFLVLVTPLGVEIGGNRNWIRIGGFVGQPSEAIKLALVVWLGVVLARKQDRLDDWRHVAVPVLPIAGGAIGVVVLGGDLGTTIVISAFFLGGLYFAGVRLGYLLAGLVGLAIGSQAGCWAGPPLGRAVGSLWRRGPTAWASPPRMATVSRLCWGTCSP